jgi:hypothetical protein
MAALSGEITRGESLFNQVLAGGLGPALLVIAAVSAASFAPAVRQVSSSSSGQLLESVGRQQQSG